MVGIVLLFTFVQAQSLETAENKKSAISQDDAKVAETRPKRHGHYNYYSRPYYYQQPIVVHQPVFQRAFVQRPFVRPVYVGE